MVVPKESQAGNSNVGKKKTPTKNPCFLKLNALNTAVPYTAPPRKRREVRARTLQNYFWNYQYSSISGSVSLTNPRGTHRKNSFYTLNISTMAPIFKATRSAPWKISRVSLLLVHIHTITHDVLCGLMIFRHKENDFITVKTQSNPIHLISTSDRSRAHRAVDQHSSQQHSEWSPTPILRMHN